MSIPFVDASTEQNAPVSLGFQILLALGNAGAVTALLPVLIVLIPSQVTQLDPLNTASSLAWVMTLGALGALIGNPLSGALSDRTTSRLGRRRPWLLVGMSGAAIGLVLMANSRSVAVLAAAWFAVQFFANMLLSGYGAVLPDRVPVRQRGTTQSIIGLASPLAIMAGDILFSQVRDPRAGYYPAIVFLVGMTLLFVFLYREPTLSKMAVSPFRWKAFAAGFWVSPRRQPDFARFWLLWLLVWLGYNVGTSGFFFLYLQNITRYAEIFPGHTVKEAVALLQVFQIVLGVPLMLATGILSDRLHQRKGFVFAGIVLIGLGLMLLIGFSHWPIVAVASVTIGAGFWVYYSMGLALVTQLLPSDASRGKDLGVINIAATLPQIIMPTIGAAIVNSFGITNPLGYQFLFGIAAAAVFLAALLLRFLRRV